MKIILEDPCKELMDFHLSKGHISTNMMFISDFVLYPSELKLI